MTRWVAPGEELQGPGSGGPSDPRHPGLAPHRELLSPAAAPGSGPAANPPSCGSRSPLEEGRLCDSPPRPLPASVSPRARRRRLSSSRLPLDSLPQPRPPPQPRSLTALHRGRGLSVGCGSAASVGVRGPTEAGMHRCRGSPSLHCCSRWLASAGFPRILAHRKLQPSSAQWVLSVCC